MAKYLHAVVSGGEAIKLDCLDFLFKLLLSQSWISSRSIDVFGKPSPGLEVTRKIKRIYFFSFLLIMNISGIVWGRKHR